MLHRDIPDEHDLLKVGHKVQVVGMEELVGKITEIHGPFATLKLDTGRTISLAKKGLRRKRVKP